MALILKSCVFPKEKMAFFEIVASAERKGGFTAALGMGHGHGAVWER